MDTSSKQQHTGYSSFLGVLEIREESAATKQMPNQEKNIQDGRKIAMLLLIPEKAIQSPVLPSGWKRKDGTF